MIVGELVGPQSTINSQINPESEAAPADMGEILKPAQTFLSSASVDAKIKENHQLFLIQVRFISLTWKAFRRGDLIRNNLQLFLDHFCQLSHWMLQFLPQGNRARSNYGEVLRKFHAEYFSEKKIGFTFQWKASTLKNLHSISDWIRCHDPALFSPIFSYRNNCGF